MNETHRCSEVTSQNTINSSTQSGSAGAEGMVRVYTCKGIHFGKVLKPANWTVPRVLSCHSPRGRWWRLEHACSSPV